MCETACDALFRMIGMLQFLGMRLTLVQIENAMEINW